MYLFLEKIQSYLNLLSPFFFRSLKYCVFFENLYCLFFIFFFFFCRNPVLSVSTFAAFLFSNGCHSYFVNDTGGLRAQNTRYVHDKKVQRIRIVQHISPLRIVLSRHKESQATRLLPIRDLYSSLSFLHLRCL